VASHGPAIGAALTRPGEVDLDGVTYPWPGWRAGKLFDSPRCDDEPCSSQTGLLSYQHDNSSCF
jgi:hypothetical protein